MEKTYCDSTYDYSMMPDFSIKNRPICIPSKTTTGKRKTRETEKKHNKKHKKSLESESDSDSDYDPSLSDSDDDTGFFAHDSKDVFAERNHLYFKADVTKQSISQLIKLINNKNWEYQKLKENKLIDKCNPAPLYLHITSYGGSVLEGFKAVSHIQNSVLPIHTIVDGYAASAGTIMSISGEKRFMTKHGYMLIHEISYGMRGKYKELQDGMENAKRWMDDIEKLYMEKTNIRKKELKKYMKHDYWWNYDKCKEFGLVDDVWTGTSST